MKQSEAGTSLSNAVDNMVNEVAAKISEDLDNPMTGATQNVAVAAETSGTADPGYWSIPNSFMKKVRKMSTNELRNKVHVLARSLMDQHNANVILSERLKTADAELKELRVLINKANDGATVSMEGTQNEK